MSALDITLVATVVAAAAIYLVWAMVGRRSSAKACHGPAAASRPGATEGDVVVGAALARGLARAQARRRRP